MNCKFLAIFFFLLASLSNLFGVENHPSDSKEALDNMPPLSFENAIHIHADSPNKIGYLYIGDHETMINQSTWLYIKQGLEFYKKEKPIFILLELNTPGGEVFAAQKISDALKEIDTQFNIPIVAFINNWAISAGAMIAYSCRFIATVEDGSMGAAEPVIAGETGKLEPASEKMNSVLRADFANKARFYGRNPLIAEAMVDKDAFIVSRNGKIIQLQSESELQLKGNNPDKIISQKGKLLTLNGEEMIADGIANVMLLPKKLPEITAEEKSAGIWPANKMLLFQAPFFSKIPQATVHAYHMDWKTRFFVFLATPLISSLLLMGLMIGGYVELNHPGLSFPGFIAVTSLFLIVLSNYSLELADWLELIFLLIGLALILTELFVLPTFGLLGILGVILFIIGLFGMLLPGINSVSFEYDTKTFNAAGEYLLQRLAWLCGSLILSCIIVIFLARYVLPNFSIYNPFVLVGHEQEASKGYVAAGDISQFPKPGTIGTALTTLRPAGKGMFNHTIFDAVSTGEFIEAGLTIVVHHLEGSVIFVQIQLKPDSRFK